MLDRSTQVDWTFRDDETSLPAQDECEIEHLRPPALSHLLYDSFGPRHYARRYAIAPRDPLLQCNFNRLVIAPNSTHDGQ